MLTLQVTNPGNSETHAAILTVRDDQRLYARSTPVQIPALRPGQRVVVHTSMTPDLVVARAGMQAKHGNVAPAGGVREFWLQQWRPGHVTLIAHI